MVRHHSAFIREPIFELATLLNSNTIQKHMQS